MYLLGALLGLALFFITLHFVDKASVKRAKKRRASRDAFSKEPLVLDVANIVDDLAPLLTPHVEAGSQITIVGSDGYYSRSKNASVFLAAIRQWLSKGATFEYLLLEHSATEDLRSTFRELLSEYPRRMRVYVLEEPALTERIKPLLERYYTFHPVLLMDEQPRALWVEGFHAPDSPYAYHVKFYSPNAIDEFIREEFEEFRRDMETIKKNSTEIEFIKRKEAA